MAAGGLLIMEQVEVVEAQVREVRLRQPLHKGQAATQLFRGLHKGIR